MVAAGSDHTLALSEQGVVFSWGKVGRALHGGRRLVDTHCDFSSVTNITEPAWSIGGTGPRPWADGHKAVREQISRRPNESASESGR